jgi:serine/threonine-protein kinase
MIWHTFRDIIIAILTNRAVKLLIIIIALFLALGLAIDWIVMPIYTKHGEAVEVPNVISMRYEEAKRRLEAEGFAIIQSDERFDEKYPIGYVVEQNPRPNANVKGGRRIYVVVSRGGRRVLMPQLVERSQRDAVLLLEKNNLKLGEINYDYSNEYPEGVIIDQSVPANAEVGVGTVVNITICSGKEPSEFTVPFVEGRTFDDAVRLIHQAGLSVGQITYKIVEDLLPETVISQSLEANIVVEKGTKIDLELSALPSSSNNNPP